MKTIIFDLDGTLANIDHRRNLATQGDKFQWDIFFDPYNIRFDTPTNICALLKSLARRHPIHILSGRSDVTRLATVCWLDKNELPYSKLLMRKEGDHTPDEKLKRLWLLKYYETPFTKSILCVFDDRDKVVKMWRDEGLTCLQVAPGDF